MRFGISFAILASLSTSSTASTFVAVANKLQSKVAMALVSLSSVAAFFDGDAMLMASAVKMPIIRIFFLFFEKRARHVSAVVHARMRDKTYPIQVSFIYSLWARVRRSHTNVGPRIQDPEENESVDSKTKFLFLFDRVRSWESYSLYCTTILSGAQTKFEHQCDVITFQPYMDPVQPAN